MIYFDLVYQWRQVAEELEAIERLILAQQAARPADEANGGPLS